MSLTKEQKQVIDRTWAVIAKDLRQNGVDLFLMIFGAKPEYKDYFPQFKGLTMDEIKISMKMRAHGSVFMNSFNGIIECLDEQDCAAVVYKKKVESHYPRGMRWEHYDALLNVVWPLFMKQKLGDQWDDAAIDAWGTFCVFMCQATKEELTRLEAEGVTAWGK